MTLYKYFALKDSLKDKLPSPNGPLSVCVLSSSIAAANAEVRKIIDDQRKANPNSDLVAETPVKRGSYAKYPSAKYAAENGIIAALRKYCCSHPELKESTIRTWRNTYITELKRKKATNIKDMEIKELPSRKRGRPFLLGAELDEQVKQYLEISLDQCLALYVTSHSLGNSVLGRHQGVVPL